MADEIDIPKEKIGAGHAQAWVRAGGKELAQALVALPDSTIRPIEEPGMVGNLTPQEVVAGKQSYEAMLSEYGSQEQIVQDHDKGMER